MGGGPKVSTPVQPLTPADYSKAAVVANATGTPLSGNANSTILTSGLGALDAATTKKQTLGA